MTLNPQIKLFLDMLPVAVFFGTYKFFSLIEATAALLVLTLITLAIIYAVERKIALAPLITALVVTVFGGLTIWFRDETFIKIKPTLVNLVFACILLGGCITGKGLLRHVFGAAFRLTQEGWIILSRRWGIFFLFMALLNEFVWRNFPTSTWVNFKVFGLLGLTMLFAVFQTGVIHKHQEKDSL